MFHVERFDRIERAETEDIANELMNKQRYYPLTDGQTILETENIDEAIEAARKTASAMMTKDQVGSVVDVTYASVTEETKDEDGNTADLAQILVIIPQIGQSNIEVREA